MFDGGAKHLRVLTRQRRATIVQCGEQNVDGVGEMNERFDSHDLGGAFDGMSGLQQ